MANNDSLAQAITQPILIIGLAVTLFAGLLIGSVFREQEFLTAEKRAEALAEGLVYFLDASAQDLHHLERAVEALGAERDVAWIAISLGTPLRVVASTRNAWYDKLNSEIPSLGQKTGLDGSLYTQLIQTEVIDPNQAGDFLHAEVSIGLDISAIQRNLGYRLLTLISVLTVSILSMVTFTYYILRHGIFQPIASIVSTMDRRTHKEAVFAPVHRPDEIGRVAQSLNKMLQEQEEHQAQLHKSFTELQLAYNTKDDFLAAMSHELRTPLNAIIGFSDTLQSGIYGPIEGKAGKAVERIHNAGHHLLNIVEEVITLSSAKHHKLTLDRQDCDLRELIHFSLSLIERAVDPIRVQVNTSLPEQACMIKGDKDKLLQVFNNLLANASKFTKDGEISISCTSVENGLFSVSIRDTGIGMNEDQLQRVFLPFTQADESINRRFGGCGLGLSIAKEIVDAHGGQIRVDSVHGQGSEFTVLLPSQHNALRK